MKCERISISFLAEDRDIIEHLNNIKNERSVSSYIRQLIHQEMLGTPSIHNAEKLAELIASKLSNSTLHISPKQEDKPTKITVSLEDKLIINNLF